MDLSDIQGMSSTLGIEISMSYIIASTIFGIVGFWAWRMGKKNGNPRVLWLGVLLMVYPLFVTTPWIVWVAGFAMCYLIRLWW